MAINKSNSKQNNEINYEVIEDYFVAERTGGYKLRLRYMKWNDREPVYDLRTWKKRDDGTEICGKGLTVSGEEVESLGDLIQRLMNNE